MIKAALIILFIYIYFYYETRDRKVIKPMMCLLALIGSFFALYFIVPFLKFDFNTAFIHSLFSLLFFAVYIPLVMGLLLVAVFTPFVSGSLADDISKRKEGKSVLLNTSIGTIAFWTFIVLFSVFVW